MGYKLLAFGLVSSLLLSFIGILAIIFGNKFIHGFVSSKIILDGSSDFYQKWLNIPYDIYLNFYLFNLKNPDEFANGEKPKFEELGPFVFREYYIRDEIIDNLNYTITFKEKRRFIFVPELSPYELDYPITTINMGPIAVMNTIRYQPSLVHSAVNLALKLTGETLLVRNMSANDLLFGYQDKFLAELKKLAPNLVPTETVGLFTGKNDTATGIYTIYTGEDDVQKVGIIERFNYETSVDFWSSKYANMINGTDGTIYPPFVDKNQKVYIYQSDTCRSLYVVYNKTEHLQDDIEVLQFSVDQKLFANSSSNPENKGFCIPEDNCLPSGLLNLTTCQDGLPVIMTFPHFLFADQKYLSEVDGLNPDYENHHTSLYLEPITGFLMKLNKRIQFNTQLFKDPRINMANNLPEVLFPLFWADENFVIDKKNADYFYHMVQLPLGVLNIGKYTTFGVGLVLLVSCLILSYIAFKNHKKQSVLNSSINRNPDEYTSLLNNTITI